MKFDFIENFEDVFLYGLIFAFIIAALTSLVLSDYQEGIAKRVCLEHGHTMEECQ